MLGPERPTLENGRLKEGQRVKSGPYYDLKTATAAERLPVFRAQLVVRAMEQGILRHENGHHDITLEDISGWTGYSMRTLQAWMTSVTKASYRPMPLAAFRHIILEFILRDQSRYPWRRLLETERTNRARLERWK